MLARGVIYYDSTANKFKVSQNGGAYTDLVMNSISAGGLNQQIQFNSSNAFAGSSRFLWDDSNSKMTIGSSILTTSVNPTVAISSGNAASNVPSLVLTNTRVGAHVQSGDGLGRLDFQGANTTPTVRIGALATEAHTNSIGGSALTLSTTANGGYVLSERMRVDQSGNVGIGTTAPASKVEADVSRSALFNAADFTTWGDVLVHNTNGSANTATGIAFFPIASSATNSASGIAAIASGNDAYTTDLAFITRPQNIASSERMRITSAGNVGIGTTTPNAKLEVSGAIVSQPATVAAATVDLSTSNTHLVASPGGSSITLLNMAHGGAYTIIVQDTTSRTYTFSGCTSSYFKPANAATTAGTQTMYGIVTVKSGANWLCYISWGTGFQ